MRAGSTLRDCASTFDDNRDVERSRKESLKLGLAVVIVEDDIRSGQAMPAMKKI